MEINGNAAIVIVTVVTVIVAAIVLTEVFAPDAIAARIEACMTQPDMQFTYDMGRPVCVPIDE